MPQVKPSSIIACFFIALSVPPALVVGKPYLDELNAVERDCVRTPKAQRTPEQVKRCTAKSHSPAGFIIPGLL